MDYSFRLDEKQTVEDRLADLQRMAAKAFNEIPDLTGIASNYIQVEPDLLYHIIRTYKLPFRMVDDRPMMYPYEAAAEYDGVTFLTVMDKNEAQKFLDLEATS